VHLSGLFIYPIKACAGIALEQAEVVERGLAFDRRYMLVDPSGTFVTQRELPQLCRVTTAWQQEQLLVSAPGMAQLTLPLRPAADLPLERKAYRVWDSVGSALEHPDGSRWFSELLNAELTLLYMPDSERRDVNPNRARPGEIVSFADAYPLLLMSEATLTDLNQRLSQSVDMRRFRPNLVISGAKPYDEDGFANVRIGALSFRGVKRCERCVVTTIDPDTAERGEEPLRTLARYRLEDNNVWLGMNLIPDDYGALRVGDAVFA
jgi:uncharacterized protein YcbX